MTTARRTDAIPFAQVAEDPALGRSVGNVIEMLSGGRNDFGVIVIIVSEEGCSIINSLRDRELLQGVLVDVLNKISTSAPNKTINVNDGLQ